MDLVERGMGVAGCVGVECDSLVKRPFVNMLAEPHVGVRTCGG